jgi:nucleoid DNA-binding protein
MCYRRAAFTAGTRPFLFFLRSQFFMAANTIKAPTKSEIYAQIVEDTGLTRKDVAAVFESLNGQIKKNLGGRNGPGIFTVPGLLKMRVVKKPATKARKGINPFTGVEMMFKAKPASRVVKVSALKGLKDMA